MQFKGPSVRFLYALNSDVNEMYLAIALRTFFVSMISVFLPIFLFTHGLNLIEIVFFYLMKAILGIPLVILVQWALKRVSFAKSMFISALSYISFLYVLNIDYSMLPLIALLSEFGDITFWVPFHYLFAHLTSKKSEGKSFGISRALLSFAPLISPLIAAFVIVNWGYTPLFLIASIGLILSIVPIILIKKHIRIKRPFHNTFDLSFRYFFEGIRLDTVFFYWPILMFIVLGDLTQIGQISSISSLIGGISMLVLGGINPDKRPIIKRLGGYLHSISVFVRAFVNDLLSVGAVMSFAMVSNTMLISPYLVEFYEQFRNKDYHLLTREINLRYGRIFVGLLLLVLIGLVDDPLKYLMILAAPASALMSLY